MKRSVVTAAIRMGGEVILLTLLVGVIIGIIGMLQEWGTSVQYSNALFIAGSLLIVSGGLSRRAAGEDWDSFQLLSAEGFRDMSPAEGASAIVSASSPLRLVILGVASGILLILVSVVVY